MMTEDEILDICQVIRKTLNHPGAAHDLPTNPVYSFGSYGANPEKGRNFQADMVFKTLEGRYCMITVHETKPAFKYAI